MNINPAQALAWLEQQAEQGFIAAKIPKENKASPAQTKKQHEKVMQVLEEAIISSSLVEMIQAAQQSTGRSLRETSRRAAMSPSQLQNLKKHAERSEVRNLARVAEAMGYELQIAFVPRDRKQKRLETMVSLEP